MNEHLNKLERRALAYLGFRGEADREQTEMIRKAIADTRRFARPQFVYRFFALVDKGDRLETDIEIGYPSLQNMLRKGNSESICILVSTLGPGIDNRLEKLRQTDMPAMVLMDACANSLIEEETDAFQERLGLQSSTFRYAPGYGDVPLSLQRQIFDLMPEISKIGIELDTCNMMHPFKSMTGLIGFKA